MDQSFLSRKNVDKYSIFITISEREEEFMHKVVLFTLVLCLIAVVNCGEMIKPTLTLEKTEFAPGEEIKVTFTAPASYTENAWVGIIPSDTPHGDEGVNDQYDIAYEYLQKQTSGVLTFTAPGQAGAYDFRMHDTDDEGKEVATVSFQVKVVTEGAGFELEKTTFKPGEEIRLTFTAPATFGSRAWVGIIPADVPHGSEDENDRHDVAYQYLEKRTQGLLTFAAPEKPGRYDFRMHDTDDNGNEITHIEFTVK
jgi:hypothetical protein